MKKKVSTSVMYEAAGVSLRFGERGAYMGHSLFREPIHFTLEELRFIAEAVQDYDKSQCEPAH